jgi:hypothetical protein
MAGFKLGPASGVPYIMVIYKSVDESELLNWGPCRLAAGDFLAALLMSMMSRANHGNNSRHRFFLLALAIYFAVQLLQDDLGA